MTRSPGAGGRHLWPFIVAALAVAAFLVGGAVEHVLRQHVGPPAAPTNLRASATTCAPPDCDVIRSGVTLTWTPASTGGTVGGFAVLRDGVTIPGQAHLSPRTVTFVDEAVAAGERHTYAVVATNTAGAARSGTIVAILPLPPLPVALLDGSYRVTLVVRRAVNLASLEGIHHPVRGSRGTSVWVFVATCRPNASPCPVRWRGHAGMLVPMEGRWAGTVTGRRAACLGGPQAPAPVRLRTATRAGTMVRGAWVVSRFTGASAVRFHCSGFAPSRGTVEVVGVRR